ncbi:hypothetical protein Anapl_05378 [Anas platyrhynchos]|uniref:Uncharacterized protein n=1 Tax=Anas platyrhynchos TaxID=8839 RepID=R0LKH4_ANAPL|nr:hypothetical protein Anapl_05378 [Anas platyrhynchos]
MTHTYTIEPAIPLAKMQTQQHVILCFPLAQFHSEMHNQISETDISYACCFLTIEDIVWSMNPIEEEKKRPRCEEQRWIHECGAAVLNRSHCLVCSKTWGKGLAEVQACKPAGAGVLQASEQRVQGLSTCPAKQQEKGFQTAYATICNGISDSLSFPVGVNFTLFDSSGICCQKNKDNSCFKTHPSHDRSVSDLEVPKPADTQDNYTAVQSSFAQRTTTRQSRAQIAPELAHKTIADHKGHLTLLYPKFALALTLVNQLHPLKAASPTVSFSGCCKEAAIQLLQALTVLLKHGI